MSDQEVFRRIVHSKIVALSHDTSFARATRSELRKAAGQDIKNVPSIWSFLYEGLEPGIFTERNFAQLEKALLATLSLYALNYQNNNHVHKFTSEGGLRVGSMLKHLKSKQSNEDSFDKKVSSLLGLSNFNEIYRKLSVFIRQSDASMDYVKFAWDLYLLQTLARTTVLHSWGTEYYRQPLKTNNEGK